MTDDVKARNLRACFRFGRVPSAGTFSCARWTRSVSVRYTLSDTKSFYDNANQNEQNKGVCPQMECTYQESL